MKNIRSISILSLGILVSIIGVYALVTGLLGDGNLGGGAALVIGVVVIGFWFAGWFR